MISIVQNLIFPLNPQRRYLYLEIFKIQVDEFILHYIADGFQVLKGVLCPELFLGPLLIHSYNIVQNIQFLILLG